MDQSELIQQAIIAARSGQENRARGLFLEAVSLDPRNEVAWMWLSGLFESLDEQISACEKVLTINPGNIRTRDYLNELKKKRSDFRSRRVESKSTELSPDANTNVHPPKYTVDLAVQLEEQGDREKALEIYEVLAAKTKDYHEFDRIYHQIIRLENLKTENIRHVSSFASLLRLSIGWPILFILLIFVQGGLKLFAWSTLYLWTGLIWISIGSFFVALVEIRSQHPIWTKLFAGNSVGGSGLARFLIGAAGWLLISISILILVLDSVNRLQNFTIPIPPY
jgi:tetratricopeptide (TPR) repeat protein